MMVDIGFVFGFQREDVLYADWKINGLHGKGCIRMVALSLKY